MQQVFKSPVSIVSELTQYRHAPMNTQSMMSLNIPDYNTQLNEIRIALAWLVEQEMNRQNGPKLEQMEEFIRGVIKEVQKDA